MARKAGSQGFRNALEERLGTQEYRRLSADGMQDPTQRGQYSAGEVISEFRERPRGITVDEDDNSMVSKYQGIVDSGSKFNNKAKSYLQDRGVNFGTQDKADDTSTNTPAPSNTSVGTSPAQGSINSPISQANPQTINGDNNQANQDNSITQSVDNSVSNTDNSSRFYGGSNRTFNYQGGSGESKLYDTPVSSATMAGFYDVDDSPAANAQFMNFYIDSNRLAQRDNRREYDSYKNTNYGPNNPGRDAGLNAQLNKSIDDSRRRAQEGRDKIFNGNNPFDFNYTLPDMPSPIISDAGRIYDETLQSL